MNLPPIGLDDIALYVPEASITMQTLFDRRVAEDPSLQAHLQRALKTTGQRAMRFPRIWEDTVTMAAQACKTLLEANSHIDRSSVRFLTLGTETGVDMSKAGSSYVLGLLEKAGHALPSSLTSFQVQHACAGGTLALLSVSAFLQAAGANSDTGLVLTSDIARYTAPSTAEITQGAGASALLVRKNPSLIELDLTTTGFFSKDVDDFFRPLGSVVAKVKGGYSVRCYQESLLGAFEDHCVRASVDPAKELEAIDIFCLHVPYSLMPIGAMEKLVQKYLNLDTAETTEFLKSRGFFESLEPTAEIGNLYTGSLYLSLAFSLAERLEKWGQDLVGKKILLASYGSGNTMVVLTGTIAAEAPKTIAKWDLKKLLNSPQKDQFAEYQNWLDQNKTTENYQSLLAAAMPPLGSFYLSGLREDGYREYALR